MWDDGIVGEKVMRITVAGALVIVAVVISALLLLRHIHAEIASAESLRTNPTATNDPDTTGN
jgi:hypothetical protein